MHCFTWRIIIILCIFLFFKKKLNIYQYQHAWQVFHSAFPYFCTLSGLGQQDNLIKSIRSIYFERMTFVITENQKAVPYYSFRQPLTNLNENTNTRQRYTFKIDKRGGEWRFLHWQSIFTQKIIITETIFQRGFNGKWT